MNAYAVQQYFEMNPHLNECFETYDGVLHATEALANSWVAGRHNVDATVTTHTKPEAAAVNLEDYVVTEQDLITNPSLADEGIKPGDVIQVDAEGVYRYK